MRGFSRSAAVVLAAGLMNGAAAAHAESPVIGPLGIRNVAPGHLVRPNVALHGVTPLAPGRWSIRTSMTIGNVWLYEPDRYLVDGEWVWLDLVASFAVSDRIQVSGGVPLIGRSGGFGDRAIEQFHRTFGLGNAGRERHPRNRLRIEFGGGRDRRVVMDSEAWGIGDPSLFLTWRARKESARGPALYVQAGGTFPVGDADELQGLGVPLASLSAVLFQRIGRSAWGWFCGAGFSYAHLDAWNEIDRRREEYSGILGIQAHLASGTCLVAQYVVVSPVAQSFYGFSSSTHELHLGLRSRLGRNLFLEVAMAENLFILNNSTDVGLHVALTGIF